MAVMSRAITSLEAIAIHSLQRQAAGCAQALKPPAFFYVLGSSIVDPNGWEKPEFDASGMKYNGIWRPLMVNPLNFLEKMLGCQRL